MPAFLKNRIPAETDMNGSSHPDHENLLHTIDSRLRASLEARRGREFVLNFDHRSAAGASLLGRRQSSYLRERVVTIPVSYLNKTIFMGNSPFLGEKNQFMPVSQKSPLIDT
jgi:hypothetical protein